MVPFIILVVCIHSNAFSLNVSECGNGRASERENDCVFAIKIPPLIGSIFIHKMYVHLVNPIVDIHISMINTTSLICIRTLWTVNWWMLPWFHSVSQQFAYVQINMKSETDLRSISCNSSGSIEWNYAFYLIHMHPFIVMLLDSGRFLIISLRLSHRHTNAISIYYFSFNYKIDFVWKSTVELVMLAEMQFERKSCVCIHYVCTYLNYYGCAEANENVILVNFHLGNNRLGGSYP